MGLRIFAKDGLNIVLRLISELLTFVLREVKKVERGQARVDLKEVTFLEFEILL